MIVPTEEITIMKQFVVQCISGYFVPFGSNKQKYHETLRAIISKKNLLCLFLFFILISLRLYIQQGVKAKEIVMYLLFFSLISFC